MKKPKQEQQYDIYQAANMLQVSAAYVRMMVRNKQIETTMVPIKEGSQVMKHLISQSELDAFGEREYKRAPRRTDGRAKCCFYASEEELRLVKELLYQTHDVGLAVVAQTMSNSKGVIDDVYIPRSLTKAS